MNGDFSYFPDVDEQKKSVSIIDEISQKATKHVIAMHVLSPDLHSINKCIAHGGYKHPTMAQVKNETMILCNRGYTISEIALLMGVDVDTFSFWCGDCTEYSYIPYSAWRLLSAYVGKSIDLMLPIK